ncbi:Panacea domain-containing protein, partial [Enterococcus faecalis]
MSKPYLAMYVADYIIDYCNKHDIEINNLKLQKVMYYLQAKSLVETNEPLIDEELQKWKYGPVVPTVYHEYK